MSYMLLKDILKHLKGKERKQLFCTHKTIFFFLEKLTLLVSRNGVALLSLVLKNFSITTASLLTNHFGCASNNNVIMDGVDESDKMLYTYLDERRTVKF